ncbi:orotidine-5'-phosphate decarboxylase [Orrella marina]|uniref:Orotidine 5'-phosphate decarboxylase n=1 Tax=Orrella marina TaxID=2163011 RepID=A0A2R4XKG9_9BURK|nr:orotidine-5'-phosphate decarboxylase [Orrella marina]AWB34312.1 orotidine-5'-phosphate decarboxylase [Orrella marina]
MSFSEKLQNSWRQFDSLLMVGLDPDPARIPMDLATSHDGLLEFCCRIIEATAPYSCGFKPQIAYFSSIAAEPVLEKVCAFIRDQYPDHVLVLDSKRGDIGSTAEQYAAEAFDRYVADAVTINPYMGLDSAQPYLDRTDKGVIVLCRTSNPGGSDLQALDVGGKPLYLHVAEMIANRWNQSGQCGLVVGATFPDELAKVRQVVGNMPLLVPGIGAQGGDIAATCKAGCDSAGYGMMINSSRAILYAGKDEHWAQASAMAASQTRDSINQYRPAS